MINEGNLGASNFLPQSLSAGLKVLTKYNVVAKYIFTWEAKISLLQ